MNAPLCEFVRRYAQSAPVRLHMPGHKGEGPLGAEALDITEIPGADSLYEARGILRQSQDNASALFGARTFYSTEGSSHCIRAMLHLAVLDALHRGKKPLIAAGRNAHKAFLSAAILLDLEPLWLVAEAQQSWLSCPLTAQELRRVLAEQPVTAVYLTAPDYLGHMPELESLSRVCREKDVLLLVDNAHGAYLKFLPRSLHPMDLGADLCCDSAHKTLPVLTGGAYLHLSPRLEALALRAPEALALYGSTSPSYLILQSLDAANLQLAGPFREALARFVPRLEALKHRLRAAGWELYGTEPLKMTLCPCSRGLTGDAAAQQLAADGIVCEFSHREHLVFMFSPFADEAQLLRLEEALGRLPAGKAQDPVPGTFRLPEKVLTPRQAAFCAAETVAVEEAVGRVLAELTVGCPPAVPLAMAGERLDEPLTRALRLCGHTHCRVIL